MSRSAQIKEEMYRAQLETKDRIMKSSINNVHQTFEQDQMKLKREMETLNQIVNSKIQESREARMEALQLSEKKKQAEIEAEILKRKLNDQQRVNQFEREANRRQLQNLERSHSKEIEIKEYQKEQLKRSLIEKEAEIHNEKINQIVLQRELNSVSLEAQRKQQEAQIWKAEARNIENQKNTELYIKDKVAQSQINQLQTRHSYEKQLVQQETSTWKNIAYNKQLEAHDWFRNYNRLYSRYVLYPPVYKTFQHFQP